MNQFDRLQHQDPKQHLYFRVCDATNANTSKTANTQDKTRRRKNR